MKLPASEKKCTVDHISRDLCTKMDDFNFQQLLQNCHNVQIIQQFSFLKNLYSLSIRGLKTNLRTRYTSN